jgi:hypothetical protein
MIQLDFPQRLHFREASSVVYPKEIFYTIYDIQLWTLANGTIWQAVFVFDNGRRWRTIKIKELKKIVAHANKMNKLMESMGETDDTI